MRKNISILIVAILCIVAITGCGGVGENAGSIANKPPVANAGPVQNVITGDLVTLDGSGSSDANGDMLTYNWCFTSTPAGSTAVLSGSAVVNPTFTADKDGAYVLSLIVNDGKASSVADTVTITAATANSAPVANAGPDQNVATSSLVALDGSNSNDVNGDTLTYTWSFTAKPASSTAALSNATAVGPTFTADKDGVYELSLVVNDGIVSSTADSVTITAATANSAPVANAGPDQEVATNTLVILDASNSSDADGDTLTYSWSFTSKPDSSAAALSSATASNPTFTADKDGAYVLSLIVNDGTISSAADTVMITVTDTDPPSVPTTLTATAVSASRINLSWTASTDNVGVVGYKVYKNGRLIGTTATNAYANTGLLSSTTYTYSVSAYDNAGNRSVASSAARATTQAPGIYDTQAPTIPTDLLVVVVTGYGTYLSWSPSTDNVGVVGYEVYRDDTLIGVAWTTSYLDSAQSWASVYTIKAFDAMQRTSPVSSSATATIKTGTGVPADQYCLASRYTTSQPTSSTSNCIFPDQTSCSTWPFYRGECGLDFTYCKKNGFTPEERIEYMPWTARHTVCIFDDSSECSEQEYLYGTCGPSECKKWLLSQGGCIAQ